MVDKIKGLYFKYEEIINYLIVGVITTVVSVAIKYGILLFILDAKDPVAVQISVIASWIVAVSVAYVLNRVFVFKSKDERILAEISKFFGARVVTLLIEAGLMWLFITALGMNSNIEVIIITLVVQFIIIVGNYVLSKFLVFK